MYCSKWNWILNICFIFVYSKYNPIQSHEQRQLYKADFNSEYEGYRDLHNKVIKVTRQFKELESSLHEKEEGSEDYEVWKEC